MTYLRRITVLSRQMYFGGVIVVLVTLFLALDQNSLHLVEINQLQLKIEANMAATTSLFYGPLAGETVNRKQNETSDREYSWIFGKYMSTTDGEGPSIAVRAFDKTSGRNPDEMSDCPVCKRTFASIRFLKERDRHTAQHLNDNSHFHRFKDCEFEHNFHDIFTFIIEKIFSIPHCGVCNLVRETINEIENIWKNVQSILADERIWP